MRGKNIMERTNGFKKGHHHCLKFIYISDVIRVLNDSCHSIFDTSLGTDVCGISLHFLHHLCNVLNTILNVSVLLLLPKSCPSNLKPPSLTTFHIHG